MGPATHRKTLPSPGSNGSYFWESIAKLLLDIDSHKWTFCSCLLGRVVQACGLLDTQPNKKFKLCSSSQNC
eukprot:15363785-Ditylum_brightwellii.AAC.1